VGKVELIMNGAALIFISHFELYVWDHTYPSCFGCEEFDDESSLHLTFLKGISAFISSF